MELIINNKCNMISAVKSTSCNCSKVTSSLPSNSPQDVAFCVALSNVPVRFLRYLTNILIENYSKDVYFNIPFIIGFGTRFSSRKSFHHFPVLFAVVIVLPNASIDLALFLIADVTSLFLRSCSRKSLAVHFADPASLRVSEPIAISMHSHYRASERTALPFAFAVPLTPAASGPEFVLDLLVICELL
ncbi:hypothetical protein ALC60_06612 [Trachymyrmex zeteki]|uniref:Uncharacterized protein n=1 Tax=Mycetomoellerius zeteki TaxID=64791 RepID=A0A151X2I3_9HYME|nr:hypothetical protein ALC60_06612 [Trachymyrmex zeteki]